MSDVHLVGELAELAGRFERISVRPSSLGVLILDLLAAWARHVPLAGSGSGWLLVSLILFLSNAAFIPAVFIPRGRVFERELAAALAFRGADIRPVRRAARSGGQGGEDL